MTLVGVSCTCSLWLPTPRWNQVPRLPEKQLVSLRSPPAGGPRPPRQQWELVQGGPLPPTAAPFAPVRNSRPHLLPPLSCHSHRTALGQVSWELPEKRVPESCKALGLDVAPPRPTVGAWTMLGSAAKTRRGGRGQEGEGCPPGQGLPVPHETAQHCSLQLTGHAGPEPERGSYLRCLHGDPNQHGKLTSRGRLMGSIRGSARLRLSAEVRATSGLCALAGLGPSWDSCELAAGRWGMNRDRRGRAGHLAAGAVAAGYFFQPLDGTSVLIQGG